MNRWSSILVLVAVPAVAALLAGDALAAATKRARGGSGAVAASAEPAPSMPRLRVIELDPDKAKSVHKVHAAPGLATVLALPEPWAVTPTCGDCVFGDEPAQGQLFRLDVFESTRTLSVKPTRVPGPDAPAASFITNIDVVLEGGLSVTFFVELVVPEAADARVEIALPEAALSRARLTIKERALEEAFSKRVAEASGTAMLDAFLTGTVCRDFFGRPNRSDGVVVRVSQLCRNGALVWVTYEVENRKRADVHLEGVSLVDGGGGASRLVRLEKDVLRFNESTRGVAALDVPAGGFKPTSYSLVVTEAGGVGRTVTVDGIAF